MPSPAAVISVPPVALTTSSSDKIAGWGNSAGAHILNMIAALSGRPIMKGCYLGNDDQDDSIQCQVSLYGPTDMYQADLCNMLSEEDVVNATGGTEITAAGEGMVFPHNLIMGFKNSKNPVAAAYGSPINFVTDQFPPAFLLHGLSDSVVPYVQSVSFMNKINETCNEKRCSLRLFPDAVHGDEAMKTDEVVNEILDFIDSQLWEGEHERTELPQEIAIRELDSDKGDKFEH